MITAFWIQKAVFLLTNAAILCFNGVIRKGFLTTQENKEQQRWTQ